MHGRDWIPSEPHLATRRTCGETSDPRRVGSQRPTSHMDGVERANWRLTCSGRLAPVSRPLGHPTLTLPAARRSHEAREPPRWVSPSAPVAKPCLRLSLRRPECVTEGDQPVRTPVEDGEDQPPIFSVEPHHIRVGVNRKTDSRRKLCVTSPVELPRKPRYRADRECNTCNEHTRRMPGSSDVKRP